MLLSICIPSYNRFSNLSRIVQSISNCSSTNFEVVIVDNCSPENVNEIIPKSDSRFRVICREKPVKGTANCRYALDFGSGDYCMMLLDKDFINGVTLDNFINVLEKNRDVTCGVCSLNESDDNTGVLITESSENLKDMYVMRHPSGMFVKRNYIQEDTRKTSKTDLESANGAEVLLARALAGGKCLHFNSPMVYTETKVEAASTTSYSYNKSNIWFHPEKQIEAFDRYSKYLSELSLSKKEKEKVFEGIYKRALISCTLGYKNIMKDEMICQHYMIEPENISMNELKKWKKKLEQRLVNVQSLGLSNGKKSMIRIAGTIFFYFEEGKNIARRRKD